MKKNFLILMAILYSAVGQAKFLKAVLYFEDGTKKTGLAELVESEDSKINFKVNEEAKKEKILSADLQRIEYVNADNNMFIVEKFYFTTANLFTGKFSKSKKKIWFYIVYDKDVKIGGIGAEGGRRPNAGGTSSVVTISNTAYYFGKKNSEDLVFGFATSANNLAVGTNSLVKKMSKEAFADCPKLIAAIEKEDFKADTVLDQLKALFEKNKCK